MAKNIVICCDGTNNQFGSNNTNVVRLVQVLNRNPNEQIHYYDPGVGTFPEPSFATKIGKWFSELMGLAFGLGLTRKVGEAYSFLMDQYQEGDQVYIFGFSRGAYTARALAGVIHQFGLLPPGNYNLVPYLLRLSKEINRLSDDDKAAASEYWKISNGFRATFARTSQQAISEALRVPIRFLGLWDTVSSVGWIWNPKHFAYTTAKNTSVQVVRHAIAIDERRWFFRQNRWGQPKDNSQQSVKEFWFPGVHCDIGGGYSEKEAQADETATNDDERDARQQSGLWQTTFMWMLIEARKAGLKIDAHKFRHVVQKTRIQRPAWRNEKHESLVWYWWPAEFFPKIPKWRGPGFHWPTFGLFRCRTIAEGALIHRSALRRLRRSQCEYHPGNLSTEFQDWARRLTRLPETTAYHAPPKQS